MSRKSDKLRKIEGIKKREKRNSLRTGRVIEMKIEVAGDNELRGRGD